MEMSDTICLCLSTSLAHLSGSLWYSMRSFRTDVGRSKALPWDVCCVKLVGRANVNDRNALLFGKEQLLC